MSQNQRPAALEDLGLVAALRAHTDAWGDLGLNVNLQVRGEPRRVSSAIEHAVYRVAQEALSNALATPGVADVDVELRFSPDELSLTVTDKGHGFRRGARGRGRGCSGCATAPRRSAPSWRSAHPQRCSRGRAFACGCR